MDVEQMTIQQLQTELAMLKTKRYDQGLDTSDMLRMQLLDRTLKRISEQLGGSNLPAGNYDSQTKPDELI